MGLKDRAQRDNIKGIFMIQYLLKASQPRKKSNSNFKKEVWTKLQRFSARLYPEQFHTRGQTVHNVPYFKS